MFNKFFYSNPRRKNVPDPAETREQQLAAIRRQQQEAEAERRARAYPSGQPQYGEENFGMDYPYYQGDPRAALAQEELRRRQAQEKQTQEDLQRMHYEQQYNQQRQPPQGNPAYPGSAHTTYYQGRDQYSQASNPPGFPNPNLPSNWGRAPPAVSVEEQNAAASKIQQAYRVHRSLVQLADLRRKFDEYRSKFMFPEIIDFQDPSGAVVSLGTVSAAPVAPIPPNVKLGQGPAKLAFTPRNRPLHAHNEDLSRLLTSLDAIESYGEKSVRQRRKDIVKNIEGHLANVEGTDGGSHGWKGVWQKAAHVRASAGSAGPNNDYYGQGGSRAR